MLQGWFLSDKLNIHGVLYIIEVKHKKLTEVLKKWQEKLNKPVFDKIVFFYIIEILKPIIVNT